MKLTPYERHIKELALVRMRAQRAKARRALAILVGFAALGIGSIAIVVPLQGNAEVTKLKQTPNSVLVLDRDGRIGQQGDRGSRIVKRELSQQ